MEAKDAEKAGNMGKASREKEMIKYRDAPLYLQRKNSPPF